MATRDPVAITGLGIVCALGKDRDAVAAACRRGERPFAKVSRFDASAFKVNLAAQAPELDALGRFGRKAVRLTSHTDRLALWAAADALAQAALPDARRRNAAVVVGASSGGMEEMEQLEAARIATGATDLRLSLSVAWSHPVWATTRCLAERLGLDGPRATYMTACSSAAHALGVAMHRVRRGDLDVAVAGGAESLCRLTLAGFGALGVLDPRATRPFAKDRAGITLGEGAAFFVLERLPDALRRGAPVLAVLAGYGASSDAHHMVHPREDGAGALAAMQAALADASLDAGRVDYVNAHGTGTVQNDAMEARAIDALLSASAAGRPGVVVSSSKSMVGHTLGAAGAIEAALTVLGMTGGFVPPNPGVGEGVELQAARLATTSEGAAPAVALSSSFAFGGNNAALVLCRPEALAAPAAKVAATHAPGPAWITGAAIGSPHGTAIGSADIVACFDRTRVAAVPPAGGFAGLDPAAVLGARATRRMDELSAALTALMSEAAKAAAAKPGPGWGIGVGTSFACLEDTRRFLIRIFEKGPGLANPLDFPNLVHNAAAGYASITFGADGPSVASCQEELSFDEALRSMSGRVRAGHLAGALCGGADLASPSMDLGFAQVARAVRVVVGHASVAGVVVLERAAAVKADGRKPWADVAGVGTAGASDGPAAAARRALGDAGAPVDLWLAGSITERQRGREDEVAALPELHSAERIEARRLLGDAGGAGGAVTAIAAALIAHGRARRVLVTSLTCDGAASATLLAAAAP